MRRIVTFIAVILLLLITILHYTSSQELNVKSCSQTVSKPYDYCVQQSKQSLICCDIWCDDVSCYETTYFMNCTVQYTIVTECCTGYNSTGCLPVCDVTECGANEYCSAPNNCSCRPEWSGSQCNKVASVSTTDPSTDSVQVTWGIPTNTSNLNGYYIYIKDTEHNITTNIVNNTVINGLEPLTEYTACVVPLILDGSGEELCAEFTTKQQVPTSPPGNIVIQNTSETAIVIQWTPPTQSNGAVTQYTVYLNSSVNSQTVHIDSRLTMAYITGLPAGEEIGIQVSAWNGAGEGVTSTYISYNPNTEITSSDEVAEVDINTALTLPTKPSPRLSWLPPPVSQDISFYVLIFTKVSSNTEIGRWALRKDQSFEEVFDSLDDSTLYRVSIFVGSVSNRFDLIHSQDFFIEQRIPTSYPSGIISKRLHETSMNISWSKVSVTDNLGRVTKYTVRYSKGAESCGYTYNTLMRTVSADDTSVLLSGLSVSSNYCVSVSVSNVAGDSPFSSYTLVPVTSQSSLLLNFSGISNCNQWKRNSTQLMELTNRLATELNNRCSNCITSDEYFINPLITCNGDDKARYSTTIIGTVGYHSSVLVQALEEWSRSTDELVVGGTYLYLGDNGSEGSSTPTPCQVNNEGFDYKIVIIAVLAILVVALTCAIIIMGIKCYSSRDSVGPTSTNIEFSSKDGGIQEKL